MRLDPLTMLDRGEALSDPERALLMAQSAPGEARPEFEPVGRTIARLLTLYRQVAADALEGTVTCTNCDEVVEFSIGIDALLGQEHLIDSEPHPFVEGDVTLRWRPVSFEDLAVAINSPDGPETLLRRCVQEQVPAASRAALAERMAEADPLAEIAIDFVCAECGEQRLAVLDVVTFAWSQIVAQAQALLVDIDVLARAYSWSEADILALPTARRRRFVALVVGDQ